MSNFYWDDINVKVDDSCPIATSDISVNLKNRQKAIDTAGYGPLNPTKPNNEFWDAKAERWNVTADDARDQKCGNCAAFIQTKRILDCIDKEDFDIITKLKKKYYKMYFSVLKLESK